MPSVTQFQCDLLRDSSFLRGAACEIQHRLRGIQQGDPKAKPREAQRNRAGTAPEIKRVRRLSDSRQRLLQVGKRQIDAQPALGRLEIGGVLICLALEAFDLGIGAHLLHTSLTRSVSMQVQVTPERISKGLATTSRPGLEKFSNRGRKTQTPPRMGVQLWQVLFRAAPPLTQKADSRSLIPESIRDS